MSKVIELYDCTLRDGQQGNRIKFATAQQMVEYARKAREWNAIIEGGFPESNPKDLEFFKLINEEEPELRPYISAFGGTKRVAVKIEKDEGVQALVRAETEIVTLVGKSDEKHVKEALGLKFEGGLDANLGLIHDTVHYFKRLDKRVIFDAEHFFQGFNRNPEYALKSLKKAYDAGADTIVLCDTNGWVVSHNFLKKAITSAQQTIPKANLGIHTHHDALMGTSNTVHAVELGVTHVQGVWNGYGERTGNANLTAIVPNVQILLSEQTGIEYRLVPPEKIKDITPFSRNLEIMLNLPHDRKNSWAGSDTFTHKAGYHASAVLKNPALYEAIPAETVGNNRRIGMSELGGRSNYTHLFDGDKQAASEFSKRINKLEHKGWEFDAAPDTVMLYAARERGVDTNIMEGFPKYRIEVHGNSANEVESLASIRAKLPEEETYQWSTAQGDGPVNALDIAAKQRLGKEYPILNQLKLTNYAVRIKEDPEHKEEHEGTGSLVWVSIESKYNGSVIQTGALHENIIEATRQALFDSYRILILKDKGILSEAGIVIKE